MTARATFKQADYDRLFKSANAAGFEGVRLVIDTETGKIDAASNLLADHLSNLKESK